MDTPSFADIAAAADRIAGLIRRTPLLANAALDAQSGARVLVKAEPLQITGSFKLRGATNALRALAPAERHRGVIAFSSGNHGQAVAAAAAAAGVAATVVMPADAPRIKTESTRAWGATIIPYDRAGEDREAITRAAAAQSGAAIIPPFDHPAVIAGQGTLGLEIAEDAGGGLDLLLVPAGGGGLVAGCALALAEKSPATRVYAVEPAGWDDTARSLAAGAITGNEAGGSALCDALMAPRPGTLTFALNRVLLAGALVVSEAEVLAAMGFAFRHLKLVVEPGGAVALAALLAGRIEVRGKRVGVVLSGGNVDPAVFARALSPPEN